MLTTIYFDEKPVFLACGPVSELAPYQDKPDVAWIENPSQKQLEKLIEAIQTPALRAGVLLQKDTDALLDGFKKAMHLVQAAGGFVHAGRQEVLLIFRRGKWDLPKGKLDEGEDLETCALREIEEETGLVHLHSEGQLYVTYHTYHHKGRHVLKESHWYMVKGDRSDVLRPQTSEDIEQCLWVRISELAPYLENAHTSLIGVVAAALEVLNDSKEV